MTVKKLSDSDKNEILKLYRETGETTSTLAERYDVSNSTISRFLKSTLQEEEYEELIQQKRAARTFGKETPADLPLFKQTEPDVSIAELLVEAEPSIASAQELTPVAKKLRRRPASSASKLAKPTTADVTDLTDQSVKTTDTSQQLPIKVLDAPSLIADTSASPINEQTDSKPVSKPKLLDTQPILKTVEPLSGSARENVSRQEQPQNLEQASGTSNVPMSLEEKAEASAIAQMFGEDLLDESEELIDIDDEDLDDEDEDDLDEDRPILTRRVSAATSVQVLPLSEANLPRTCYLVIDRASELITRPLREFGELGQIPSQEVHQKTLPVFDNHRIARRFSTKRDRVIKVPDSRMLQKTRSQLEAKGITLLLVDGQVYSLSR